MILYDMICYDMIWYDVMYDTMYDMIYKDIRNVTLYYNQRYYSMWCDVIRYDTLRYDTILCDMKSDDMKSDDMKSDEMMYDVIWCMKCYNIKRINVCSFLPYLYINSNFIEVCYLMYTWCYWFRYWPATDLETGHFRINDDLVHWIIYTPPVFTWRD